MLKVRLFELSSFEETGAGLGRGGYGARQPAVWMHKNHI